MSEQAFFGGGCFWCLEAVFDRVRGVNRVEPGYMGGHIIDPSYEQICTGTTGHAEVVRISFTPELIDFETLLRIFFSIHDPTTLDRQGNDIGPQYRSIVFHRDINQRELTKNIIEEVDRARVFRDPIVTEAAPVEHFYPAENYHNDYFINNPSQPYCQVIINPKMEKFRNEWAKFLKTS